MSDTKINAPRTIDTPRLHLRRPVLKDSAWIFEQYATDPEVTRHLLWNPHDSIEDTREFLGRCHEAWRDGTGFPYVIEWKETGAGVGMIDLRLDGHRGELGYVLARPWWGRGIMTEAVRAMTAWASKQRAIQRLFAHCHIENIASAHVLNNAGFTLEGTLYNYQIFPNLGEDAQDVFSFVKR